MPGFSHRAFVLASAFVLPIAFALVPAARAADAPTPPPYVPPPYVAATPDPSIPTYDDASIHFAAPSGWKKIELQPDSQNPNVPSVAFVQPARYDAVSIGIAISEYSQTLQRFDIDHEQEIRQAEGYIEHSGLEKLSNGMPAYFVISNAGEGTDGTRRYEWLVIDGKRSIIVTEVARRGVVDEATARKQLSTLTVVVYPAGSN